MKAARHAAPKSAVSRPSRHHPTHRPLLRQVLRRCHQALLCPRPALPIFAHWTVGARCVAARSGATGSRGSSTASKSARALHAIGALRSLESATMPASSRQAIRRRGCQSRQSRRRQRPRWCRLCPSPRATAALLAVSKPLSGWRAHGPQPRRSVTCGSSFWVVVSHGRAAGLKAPV